jgi:hypothetical protein
MVDGSVRSLRSLIYSSLLVLLIWFVAWPSARQRLALFHASVDLHAWLYLKEVLAMVSTSDYEKGGPISTYMGSGKPKAPSYQPYPRPFPLEVRAFWPTVGKYPIQLAPDRELTLVELSSPTQVFRIETDSLDLPLTDYRVIWMKDWDPEVAIVHKQILNRSHVPLTGRRLESIMSHNNHPLDWDVLAMYLGRHGFTGEPAALSINNRVLGYLRAESDPRLPSSGVQVFGIQFSSGQFISAVGGLLAAIAFAMIGPLSILHRSQDKKHNQPWVITLPHSVGLTGWAVEATLTILSLAWAVAPLALFGAHIATYLEYGSLGAVSVFLGGAGLLFSSIIYLLVIRELYIVRAHN